MMIAAMAAWLVMFAPAVAQAQDDAGPADAAQELAERYAPVMMLKAQEAECDASGEPYFPIAVEILLDNPQILLRQVGTDNPVMGNAPSAPDLFGLREGFYLDFPGDALSPGCIYEQDGRVYSAGTPSTVYAHVAQQEDRPDQLALQYWFFWYYNDWNNKHEGDWEGIQLLFDAATVEEALERDPSSVGYAQHEGGERADWDDEKLERRGTHPVVYSSAGSHASYYGSALYLGRSGSEGFGCDTTDGPSDAVEPAVVVLPDSVDDPDDPLAWLNFEGRWGERQSGPFNGPTGPALKERWTHPVDWHDELRTNSVVVPGGDSTADQLIRGFCSAVEFGSAQLITLKQSPGVLLVSILILLSVISALLGRTDWSPVEPLPIVRRRRAGQIIKTARGFWFGRLSRFLPAGAVYLIASLAVGLVVSIVAALPIVGTLLSTERDIGAVGILIAVTVGVLAYSVSVAFVVAVVSVELRGIEQGTEISSWQSARMALAEFGHLLAALVRAAAIVLVLMITVVGIPWGLRQVIRYQFVPQVTVLEGRRGRDALARSSELARGRWWHTAGVIALVTLLVVAFGSLIGLLLLVLLVGLPLWLFSTLVTAATALVIPYVALTYLLLYGDAAAEREGAPAAARLDEPGRSGQPSAVGSD